MILFALIPFSEPYEHIRARNISYGVNEVSVAIFDLNHPRIVNSNYENYELNLEINDFSYQRTRSTNVQLPVALAEVVYL